MIKQNSLWKCIECGTRRVIIEEAIDFDDLEDILRLVNNYDTETLKEKNEKDSA